MKVMRFIYILSLSFLMLGCGGQKQAKYIFYFIGDGFGLSQSIMAEDYLDFKAGDSTTTHLEILKMPITGFATTYSASSWVTCSSAAGTALSTGVKTNNGMLGVRPDTSGLVSVARRLHEKGYNVGIISSVSLDHATPAAFYANVASRGSYVDITRQATTTGFEFFGGGTFKGIMKDSTLVDTLKNAGYTILNSKELIDAHSFADGKLIASSSITLSSGEIPYVIDEPKHNMHLSYFVQKVIDLFEPSPKPFFVMVEGGKIDWSCHGNDPASTLHEVLEMDKAYRFAYEFFLRHSDETLIVVTADHETGGLGLGTGAYVLRPELLDNQTVSEEKFSNIVDKLAENEASKKEIYNAIEQNFGFNNGDKYMSLNRLDSVRIDLMYKVRFSEKNKEKSDKLEAYDMHANETFSSLCLKMMSMKSCFGWTSHNHTGVAVPVRAIGVGSENFMGFYDNTDIPRRLYSLAGYTEPLN